ncbi:MAG: sialidase family protein, partial [Oscillospiraceae bacterium]|nr:sialidase family protein [Oscillospiraceae bacterium]
LNMGGGKLMSEWYNLINYMYFKRPLLKMLYDTDGPFGVNSEDFLMITAHMRSVDIETQKKDYGSWVCVSEDNGMTWKEPTRCPIASFHGPMLLQDGSLLYLGKDVDGKETGGVNRAYKSTDDGVTWEHVSDIPIAPDEGLSYANFVDPHGVQLPNGRIICHIRYQNGAAPEKYGSFTIFQTVSDDNGKTWSTPECLKVNGSPPHLLRHSSGALICTYGRRSKPFGESAMVSLDDGKTWITELILRDDTKNSDLGFPSSVELPDGSIYTVYSQYIDHPDGSMDKKASILATKWSIEEILKANGR